MFPSNFSTGRLVAYDLVGYNSWNNLLLELFLRISPSKTIVNNRAFIKPNIYNLEKFQYCIHIVARKLLIEYAFPERFSLNPMWNE